MPSKITLLEEALRQELERREVPISSAREPTVQAPEDGSLSVSDELLLTGVRDGERDALGQLFRRHARTVRNVAYRILRDEAEADDLVQEVFLFVFRKAGLFDPNRGSAVSWLVQVAFHRAFDRRRRLRARGFYSHCELDEVVLAREDPRAAVHYEDTIEAAIGQDALRRIEASLSEVQRRVLHLRFFDGLTIDEIAALLGQSAGNVRNHYYRGLEKMRREVFAGKLKGK